MNFTKKNSGGFGIEFMWRGLVFTWHGPRRRYECKREHGTWWVSSTSYEKSLYLKTADPAENPEDYPAFAESKFIAHCGHGGDAAERLTMEDALEASLQYALRYHHGRIHDLRALSFAPVAPEVTDGSA